MRLHRAHCLENYGVAFHRSERRWSDAITIAIAITTYLINVTNGVDWLRVSLYIFINSLFVSIPEPLEPYFDVEREYCRRCDLLNDSGVPVRFIPTKER